MEERILTVKEAASILRISQSQLYKMTKEKLVPHLMLGGRIVIPEKQLRAWIDSSVSGGYQ